MEMWPTGPADVPIDLGEQNITQTDRFYLPHIVFKSIFPAVHLFY